MIELQRVYNKLLKLIFALLVVKVPLPVLHASTRARSFALMELRSGQRLGDMAAQLQDPQSPPSTSEAAAPVQEQALFELTLVDALHCDRLRTDQARQRQGAMVDPSRRHQQLSGDVR